MREEEAIGAELRCAFDLKPVPPRRRARRAEYCSERCKRTARQWREREARKATRS